MFQPELIYESNQDALRDAVKALGGSKVVGHMLRPTLPIDQAKTWCNDCLNPERRQKFDLEDIIVVLRKAREAGFHGAMNYIAGDIGYQATPIEPADEQAKLQRDFIASVETQRKILARLERLSGETASAPLRSVG